MNSTRIFAVLAALAVATTAHAADSTAARLAAIEDDQAISRLMSGDYPRALDERRWADYAALFTADGELAFAGQVIKGPAAIQKFFEAQPVPADARSLHVISNPLINIAGDTATGGAYWQTIALVDGRPAVQSAGRYEDALKKVNGRWMFAKRAIVVDLAPPPVVRPPAAPAPR